MNRPCKNATRPTAKITVKAPEGGAGRGPATFDGRENKGSVPRASVGKKATTSRGIPAQSTRLS